MRRLVLAWKIFTEAFLFLLYIRKIQYIGNLAASSDFAVTSRRIIIYTG